MRCDCQHCQLGDRANQPCAFLFTSLAYFPRFAVQDNAPHNPLYAVNNNLSTDTVSQCNNRYLQVLMSVAHRSGGTAKVGPLAHPNEKRCRGPFPLPDMFTASGGSIPRHGAPQAETLVLRIRSQLVEYSSHSS